MFFEVSPQIWLVASDQRTSLLTKESRAPSQYKDRLSKNKIPLNIRRSWDHLIFIMGIPILLRQYLYIETAPHIFSLLAILCLRPWRVRILHSAEEDNLSPFDSNIACLCQSIEINNNKQILKVFISSFPRCYIVALYSHWSYYWGTVHILESEESMCHTWYDCYKDSWLISQINFLAWYIHIIFPYIMSQQRH